MPKALLESYGILRDAQSGLHLSLSLSLSQRRESGSPPTIYIRDALYMSVGRDFLIKHAGDSFVSYWFD